MLPGKATPFDLTPLHIIATNWAPLRLLTSDADWASPDRPASRSEIHSVERFDGVAHVVMNPDFQDFDAFWSGAHPASGC